jgi:hypothetical protein
MSCYETGRKKQGTGKSAPADFYLKSGFGQRRAGNRGNAPVHFQNTSSGGIAGVGNFYGSA